MRNHFMLAAALAIGTAVPAQAQTAVPAPQRPAASAPSSPAKKALVVKILALQQPGIEAMARQLTEQPAAQLMQAAGQALQRLPAERREAVAKDIQADARKYADETTPLVRERAVKLAPQTIGVLLEERMTEDELKQVVAILESPANRKFQSLAGDMQRGLVERLVADTRPTVEPRVKALEQGMAKRLELPAAPPPPAPAPGASRP